MGAPLKVLTDNQIADVEKLAAVLNQEQLSDYLGISHDTFSRICERDDKVMRSYKRGRANAIKEIGSSLMSKALDGDTSCQIFFLKTRAGWKEAKDDTNVNVQGSVNITHEIVGVMPDAIKED